MSVVLDKLYDPKQVEAEMLSRWDRAGAFRSTPDSRGPDKRFVVMMPLPNVTGSLHLGHAINNTTQDVMTRWHRMMGFNSLYQPGTDHAGIATQAVVEKRIFEEEKKSRHDLGRDELVRRIWEWKDQFEVRILSQLKMMGCSCDWERVRFTLDEKYNDAVLETFFRWFRDGLIYRGERLVNWDCELRTAVADDEVYHAPVKGQFYHFKYPIEIPPAGGATHLGFATTRPETMLGDTALAVHPTDPRYKALVGRTAIVPLFDPPRRIPIIADEYANPEKGTGCVKITPAHDPNDYQVGLRHKLPMINMMTPDARVSEAGGEYAGTTLLEARKAVTAKMESLALLDKIEDVEIDTPHSDRSKSAIQPFLSKQWFVRMGDVAGGVTLQGLNRAAPVRRRGIAEDSAGTESSPKRVPGLAQAAIDAVSSGRVRVIPERYAKSYTDWLSEKRDWCISRQLWWGHRIPVWYAGSDVVRNVIEKFDSDEIKRKLEEFERTGCAAHSQFAGEHRPYDQQIQMSGYERAIGGFWCPRPEALDEFAAFAEPLGFNRDPDVLDTWFSSQLWPYATIGWPEVEASGGESAELRTSHGVARQPLPSPSRLGRVQGRGSAEGEALLPDGRGSVQTDLEYYYPGTVLITSRDIITLWVARMVLSGLYNMGTVPFRDVYIHPKILDGRGETMSKSKGNGVDPIDIIEVYGADAMRYSIADMTTETQDVRMPVEYRCPHCQASTPQTAQNMQSRTIDCKACKKTFATRWATPAVIEQHGLAQIVSEKFEIGRNFCNKLWNAARFAMMNLEGVGFEKLNVASLPTEDRWILAKTSQTVRDLHENLSQYRFAAAVKLLRDYFWDSLCDWYIELTKARMRDGGGADARQVLAFCLDQILRLLHPFTPFITERLWSELNAVAPRRGIPGAAEPKAGELLVTAEYPPREGWPALDDDAIVSAFETLQAATRAVRDLRQKNEIPPKQPVTVTVNVPADQVQTVAAQASIIKRLANVGQLRVGTDLPRARNSGTAVVGSLQVHVHDVSDDAVERASLEQELADVLKQMAAKEAKLGNEGFVRNAKADVVDAERDRLTALRERHQALERNLALLR